MPTLSLTTIADGALAVANVLRTNYSSIQTVVNGLDNVNIASGAAIAYSKLNLAGQIVNNDINAAAAIAASKLAGYPSSSSQFLRGDGTWAAPAGSGPGVELDYKQITANVTGISATTEGTATAVITGNSITYDGTKNKVEFMGHFVVNGGAHTTTFVLFRDATALGQFLQIGPNGQEFPIYLVLFDTPSAAAHTYAVKVFVSANTTDVMAGAGGSGAQAPAFLRVTKA